MKSLWKHFCRETAEKPQDCYRETGVQDLFLKRMIHKVHPGWAASLLTAGATVVGIDSLSAVIQILTDLLWNDFQIYEKGLYIVCVI